MREDAVKPEQVRALARAWWLAVALGLLSLIAGGLVLAKPDHSLRAVAVIIGIFVLIDGAVELYLSLAGRVEDRATAALLAIVNVIVGVLLIRHPIAGVQAIALFIGIWLIAVGVLRGLAALDTPAPRLGRLIVAGVEIIAGIVIVSSPNIGYATLALLVGLVCRQRDRDDRVRHPSADAQAQWAARGCRRRELMVVVAMLAWATAIRRRIWTSRPRCRRRARGGPSPDVRAGWPCQSTPARARSARARARWPIVRR